MSIGDLLDKLGRKAVAARCRVGATAVSNWPVRGIPTEHHVAVWQMALDAGLDWTPPGAEALRDKLRGQPGKAA